MGPIWRIWDAPKGSRLKDRSGFIQTTAQDGCSEVRVRRAYARGFAQVATNG